MSPSLMVIVLYSEELPEPSVISKVISSEVERLMVFISEPSLYMYAILLVYPSVTELLPDEPPNLPSKIAQRLKINISPIRMDNIPLALLDFLVSLLVLSIRKVYQI